jgi:hypothetical protein
MLSDDKYNLKLNKFALKLQRKSFEETSHDPLKNPQEISLNSQIHKKMPQ